jgi:hypothetical protein
LEKDNTEGIHDLFSRSVLRIFRTLVYAKLSYLPLTLGCFAYMRIQDWKHMENPTYFDTLLTNDSNQKLKKPAIGAEPNPDQEKRSDD